MTLHHTARTVPPHGDTPAARPEPTGRAVELLRATAGAGQPQKAAGNRSPGHRHRHRWGWQDAAGHGTRTWSRFRLSHSGVVCRAGPHRQQRPGGHGHRRGNVSAPRIAVKRVGAGRATAQRRTPAADPRQLRARGVGRRRGQLAPADPLLWPDDSGHKQGGPGRPGRACGASPPITALGVHGFPRRSRHHQRCHAAVR